MNEIFCIYRNNTENFQIITGARIERYLEPGAAIELEAGEYIIKDGYVSSIIADRIVCSNLTRDYN